MRTLARALNKWQVRLALALLAAAVLVVNLLTHTWFGVVAMSIVLVSSVAELVRIRRAS